MDVPGQLDKTLNRLLKLETKTSSYRCLEKFFGLIGYLIYQYIQSIFKFGFTTFYIISFATHKYKYIIQLDEKYLIILNPTTQKICLLSLSLFAQIYITYFIQRFYYLLKKAHIHYN